MESERASSTRKRRWQRLVIVLYAVALSAVSLLPTEKLPAIPNWSDLFSPDKIAHFGAYALFTLLLSFELVPRFGGRGLLYAVLLAAAFGALMELLQGAMGVGREADYVDMVANLLGALLGGLFFWLANKLYTQVFPSRKTT